MPVRAAPRGSRLRELHVTTLESPSAKTTRHEQDGGHAAAQACEEGRQGGGGAQIRQKGVRLMCVVMVGGCVEVRRGNALK